jgi:hypothetical protein
MVWGALSYRGFYMTIIDGPGTINSQKYCQIIEEFLTYADCLYPTGWILQQDGATPHTSRATKAFFEEKNVQIMQWPPNSPDLSPIDNVWQILKDYVEKKNPQNLAEREDISSNPKMLLPKEFESVCWTPPRSA